MTTVVVIRGFWADPFLSRRHLLPGFFLTCHRAGISNQAVMTSERTTFRQPRSRSSFAVFPGETAIRTAYCLDYHLNSLLSLPLPTQPYPASISPSMRLFPYVPTSHSITLSMANNIHRSNVVSMLGRRRRRWPSIETALAQHCINLSCFVRFLQQTRVRILEQMK